MHGPRLNRIRYENIKGLTFTGGEELISIYFPALV